MKNVIKNSPTLGQLIAVSLILISIWAVGVGVLATAVKVVWELLT